MTSATSSYNLYASLKRRETHSGSGVRNDISRAINARIAENIAQDHFFAYEVNLGNFTRCARNGNWFACSQDLRISLYDLVARKVMWTSEVPKSLDFDIHSLEVFQKGDVHLYSVTNGSRLIHINCEGTIIAHTRIPFSLSSARFFATFNANDVLIYSARNQALKVLNSQLPTVAVRPNDRYNDHGTTAVHGKEFYVLLACHLNQPQIPSKAFVFDHLTEKTRIFDVDTHAYNKEIPFATIHKTHLFCSINKTERNPKDRLWWPSQAKITVMSLVTGERVQTYESKDPQGSIVHCVANDDHLVYRVLAHDRIYRLWGINRHNHEQTFISSTDDERVRFSLSGNFLNIFKDKGHSLKLSIVDLSENLRIVKRVTYLHCQSKTLSFEEGKLIIYDRFRPNAHPIYVEDFERVDTPVNRAKNPLWTSNKT